MSLPSFEWVMMKLMRRSKSLLTCSLVLLVLALAVRSQQSTSDDAKAREGNECKLATIIGAVRTPSRFELQRKVRLRELIACAGGFADKVGKAVQIVHTDPPRDFALTIEPGPKNLLETIEIFGIDNVLRGEEKANPLIRPGDIVVVPERDPIFVNGGVLAPQAIIPSATITLTQAIAMAGGLVHGNKGEKVKIVRQDLGSTVRTELTVDLKAIKQHRAEDPALQEYDIVDVPGNPRGDTVVGYVDWFRAIPLRSLCEDSQFFGLRR